MKVNETMRAFWYVVFIEIGLVFGVVCCNRTRQERLDLERSPSTRPVNTGMEQHSIRSSVQASDVLEEPRQLHMHPRLRQTMSAFRRRLLNVVRYVMITFNTSLDSIATAISHCCFTETLAIFCSMIEEFRIWIYLMAIIATVWGMPQYLKGRGSDCLHVLSASIIDDSCHGRYDHHFCMHHPCPTRVRYWLDGVRYDKTLAMTCNLVLDHSATICFRNPNHPIPYDADRHYSAQYEAGARFYLKAAAALVVGLTLHHHIQQIRNIIHWQRVVRARRALSPSPSGSFPAD